MIKTIFVSWKLSRNKGFSLSSNLKALRLGLIFNGDVKHICKCGKSSVKGIDPMSNSCTVTSINEGYDHHRVIRKRYAGMLLHVNLHLAHLEITPTRYERASVWNRNM
jgi:hypothetical protein